MLAWIYIQQIAREYAAKHPEFGAMKEEGLGCGKNCGCKGGYSRGDLHACFKAGWGKVCCVCWMMRPRFFCIQSNKKMQYGYST
jgi:hypothetical protein